MRVFIRERHGQRDKGEIQRGEKEQNKTKIERREDRREPGQALRAVGEEGEKEGPQIEREKSGDAEGSLGRMDRLMEGPRQCRAPRPTRAPEADRQAAGPEGVSAEPADRAGHRGTGGGGGQGGLRGAAPLSGVIFHLGRLIFVPGEDNE